MSLEADSVIYLKKEKSVCPYTPHVDIPHYDIFMYLEESFEIWHVDYTWSANSG